MSTAQRSTLARRILDLRATARRLEAAARAETNRLDAIYLTLDAASARTNARALLNIGQGRAPNA